MSFQILRRMEGSEEHQDVIMLFCFCICTDGTAQASRIHEGYNFSLHNMKMYGIKGGYAPPLIATISNKQALSLITEQ